MAPEQGWDLEKTLTSLSVKGRLDPDAWRSPKAGFQVFTALRSQLLLEPLTVGTATQSGLSPSTEQGLRYRVPPLLTQTVIQHLKNRNIVH